MKEVIDQLERRRTLSKEEFVRLIEANNKSLRTYLFERAREVKKRHYGDDVYIRGLIEFTNICKNDCYYCGIRKSNGNAKRYRLCEEEILECCKAGYDLGFRTFVLQGGEDAYFTEERMVSLIREIRKSYPECAITLSIGEKSRESYERFFEAGANRYLLRHETASKNHYEALHPKEMSYEQRRRCLYDLKDIGYQVGAGFMVGSPGQTANDLAEDLLFLADLKPHMIGIGPFIPHKDTQFAKKQRGSLEDTLFFLGILRLMFPTVLLPATTALGSIAADGRELGLLAGANVVMPNLSPVCVRDKYKLYDNKICTREEAAECIVCLTKRMESIGSKIVVDRGDYKEEY